METTINNLEERIKQLEKFNERLIRNMKIMIEQVRDHGDYAKRNVDALANDLEEEFEDLEESWTKIKTGE